MSVAGSKIFIVEIFEVSLPNRVKLKCMNPFYFPTSLLFVTAGDIENPDTSHVATGYTAPSRKGWMEQRSDAPFYVIILLQCQPDFTKTDMSLVL